ncbi:MAG: (d)CMP kinase [Clostridiales bacterium]|jgi:cytidylate kinase|nr:(d)CMP kinase [Clostridiales bacterium]
MISVRGATTVEANAKHEILQSTRELLEEMLKANGLEPGMILSVFFTATRDLDQAYPAVAAREIGIVQAGLMCFQEMYVEGSLAKCIRADIFADCEKSQDQVAHVYLRQASGLRPDLSRRYFAVAIDGPSGVGKSTLAREIAKELSCIYVDTGAMYRACALHCIRRGASMSDEKEIARLASGARISIKYKGGEQRVFLGDEDVTDLLRSHEVSDGSSKVAAVSSVREKMVEIQREIGAGADVVMDGRDIATKVLPWAQVKIYLDASICARAFRRAEELSQKGIETSISEVSRVLEERDFRDKNRKDSPLVKSAGAFVIDTSDMTLQMVKEKALKIIEGVKAEKGL